MGVPFLLASAALLACGMLHAQVRGRAPDVRGIAPSNAVNEELDSGRELGSPPCPRWSLDDNQPLKWWSSAWTIICIEKARSDAVAMAWAQGKDAHGAALDAHARARKLAELQLWLRRLVGTFEVEGMRWNAVGGGNVRGVANCFGIGNGPGVSCVLSAGWKPRKEDNKNEGRDMESYSAVRPQILLFGLDPDAMEIRITHVDSVAVGMHGFLVGNSVILTTRSPPSVLAVTASPGGSPTQIYHAPPGPPLGRVSPEALDRASPTPLSRVAIDQFGNVDLKFYVYPPDMVTFLNQPIEFSLQLIRDSQADSTRSLD